MSKKRKRLPYKLATLLLVTLIPALGWAQDTYNYGGLFEVGISKKFNKTLQVSLSEELRTKNVYELGRLSTGLSLTYNLPKLKQLKFKVGYDLLTYFDQNVVDENRHRVMAHLQYKYSLQQFNISLCTKFMATFRDETRGDYKNNPKYVWRNKLQLDYKIWRSSWTPFISCETTNTVAQPQWNALKKLRYQLGVDYEINKKNELTFFLRYDDEINTKARTDFFGIGVGYGFKL